MTGLEIKNFFESLIDGETLDDDFTYSLMNFVKDKIEGTRDWEFLKKFDETQSGAGWKTLPSDYLSTIWIYVGTDIIPYAQIPFEQLPSFDTSNQDRKFVIDWRGDRYKLLNTNASGTHRHIYICSTEDLTSTTSPTWPTKFHKLIALGMAELYPVIDQAEKTESWDAKWEKVAKDFLQTMINWDINIKKRTLENGYSINDFMESSVKTVEWYPTI